MCHTVGCPSRIDSYSKLNHNAGRHPDTASGGVRLTASMRYTFAAPVEGSAKPAFQDGCCRTEGTPPIDRLDRNDTAALRAGMERAILGTRLGAAVRELLAPDYLCLWQANRSLWLQQTGTGGERVQGGRRARNVSPGRPEYTAVTSR